MYTIDTEKFYSLLWYGEFEKAQELAKNLGIKELWEIMIIINHEKPTILSYGYVISLLIQKETAEYHSLASRILVELLHSMEGAYPSGYWHAKRANELAPKEVDYQVQLLKFYSLPGELLSKQDAILMAKEVLLKDPNNKAALTFISK